MKKTCTLLLSCPDKKGIVAEVSNFIYKNDGNITHSDEHRDDEEKVFFMRIEWDLKGFKIEPERIAEKFSPIAKKFRMKYDLKFSWIIPNVCIFVSKYEHCLIDLLLRHREGEFKCNIPLIISNHDKLSYIGEEFNIPFYVFPKSKRSKLHQEKKELKLLKEYKINLIVLARYMQILSPYFVKNFKNRIINIHHSFLPSFTGKNPYLQAYKRGVKLIGATAHYVTEKLDSGPIIEQDVIRVSHRDTLEDLKRKGRDMEKIVLARAVRLHLQNKILVYKNKTVIFD
ncbi:MAG: formyltetrahydrofolate deformylase [Caldiserica bacterium]|nr:MAG: formyltetrahydrofolate deformylase [Caldisericota bacterium]